MSNKTIDVLDVKGKKAGSVDLPEALFDVQTNIPLIHQVVVAQLAAARSGNHKVKTRGEVRGGGIKPWRQKGTGRARQGSIRAPQWTGGGIVHGPLPRDYGQRTPKKMIAAALRGALSDRAREDQVFVIKELVAGEKPSTKAALETLSAFGDIEKVLLVLDRFEDVAWMSVRNAPTVHALVVDQLNTYDVVVNDKIVFTEAALAAFVAGPAKGKSVKAVATEDEAVALESEVVEEPKAEEKPAAKADKPAAKAPTKAAAKDEKPAAKAEKPAAKAPTKAAAKDEVETEAAPAVETETEEKDK